MIDEKVVVNCKSLANIKRSYTACCAGNCEKKGQSKEKDTVQKKLFSGMTGSCAYCNVHKNETYGIC